MQTQIWLGPEEPSADKFRVPVFQSDGRAKPASGTGFWTSTWDGKGGEWWEWCWDNRFGPWRQYPWWLLDVEPGVRVLDIATAEEAERFIDTYGLKDPTFDLRWIILWPEVSRDWDGIHLVDYWKVYDRMSNIGRSLVFYGWDCESTLWMRWMFSNIKRVELPAANEPPYPGVSDEGGERDGTGNE